MRRLALFLAAVSGFALAVVPALADNQTITTSGNRFVPEEVAVKPGEKVTIHNGGMGFHDLNWADGAPGQPAESVSDWSTDRTFDTAGTYVFFCEVHGDATSGMRGRVHVNEAGTVPGAGGGGGTQTSTSTTTTPPPSGTTTTSTTPPPPPPGGGGTTEATPTVPPPPSAGGDTTAPRASGIRVSASRRGVTVRLTLSEAATVTVRVLRGARRVVRRSFDVAEGRATLRLRRALRRGRYAVRLGLADEAGNRSSRSLAVRVR